MTGTDLIVLAPWIVFAAGLAVIGLVLLRSRPRPGPGPGGRPAALTHGKRDVRRRTHKPGRDDRRASRGIRGPLWRALLEARWQDRVREVTELSLAYHVAAAAVPGGTGDGTGQPETQALLRRAVAARRKLADVEEALAG